MQVKEIMTGDVKEIRSTQTILEVAKEMADADIGALPVFEGERVVGMVTDRDIVIRGLALGLDVATETVDKVMSPSVVSIAEDSTVKDAVQEMEAKQLRRLVVRDEAGRVCGIVSLADIAQRIGRQTAGELLQEVSKERAGEAAGPVRS
jgi:CBS domain-containing protein